MENRILPHRNDSDEVQPCMNVMEKVWAQSYIQETRKLLWKDFL
jgi:hypothetical protein